MLRSSGGQEPVGPGPAGDEVRQIRWDVPEERPASACVGLVQVSHPDTFVVGIEDLLVGKAMTQGRVTGQADEMITPVPDEERFPPLVFAAPHVPAGAGGGDAAGCFQRGKTVLTFLVEHVRIVGDALGIPVREARQVALPQELDDALLRACRIVFSPQHRDDFVYLFFPQYSCHAGGPRRRVEIDQRHTQTRIGRIRFMRDRHRVVPVEDAGTILLINHPASPHAEGIQFQGPQRAYARGTYHGDPAVQGVQVFLVAQTERMVVEPVDHHGHVARPQLG